MEMSEWQAIWESHGRVGIFFLVGMGILLFLWCRWRRRRQKIDLMGGEFGSISISMGALREVLSTVCEEVVERPRSKISIRMGKNNLRLRIRLRAPVGENVQEMARKIQRLAAAKLHSQFGLEQPCSIDVLIGGFRTGKGGRGCGEISWETTSHSGGHSPTDRNGTH
jgi:hypothetical protein